jgi:hypothetical protein
MGPVVRSPVQLCSLSCGSVVLFFWHRPNTSTDVAFFTHSVELYAYIVRLNGSGPCSNDI